MRKKTWLSASIATVMLAGVVAGCGDSSEEGAGNAGAGAEASAKPTAPQITEVSMMLPLYVPEAPKLDGKYYTKLNGLTNGKLTLNWVPSTNYDDKLNVTLASGDLPKAMVVTNTKLPAVVSAVRAGAFWEIGPYLKDYPNISSLPEIGWKNTAIDGKQYGIYRYRHAIRDGFIYRKDWLDSLGLKEPATTDELYNVLKAFALNDPDKNGKDDTYGLVERSNMYSFRIVTALFGAPTSWEQKDGKFTPAWKTPAYMNALNFYKKLYDEKILNPDFATLKNANDTIYKSKAGSTFVTIDNAPGFERETQKLNPAAKFDVMQGLANSAEARVPTFAGHNGIVMFPKSSVKTEAELKSLLAFFDRMGSNEAKELFTWGLEGDNFKLENGKKVLTTTEISDEQKSLEQVFVYPLAEDKAVTPLEIKINRLILKDSVKIAYLDPTAPLISKTQSEKGPELDKIIGDANIKYIMGAINETQYQAEIDKWSKQGGDQIAKEYEEEFAKAAKK
ncbi:MAG: sugar transporter permease [Paenibacillaceae bacterium]|jgi:putative aldouronate transport system substrate-binding protein|nr:sugar transporter permease [Paenibacillaceae bacterium]